MRKVIADFINTDPLLELAGIARDGEDALVKVKELKPDVITLDVEMPRMDGLRALELIMEKQPTPVIMLSSLTQEGADITINALNKGAVDFVQKPGGHISLNLSDVKDELLAKIKMASGVKVRKQLSLVEKTRVKKTNIIHKAPTLVNEQKFVLIGTSTGGPKALHQLISDLPPDLNASVLVVQHMPAGFTKSLAQRLDSLTPLTVKEAEENEIIEINKIYIAPGNYHLGIVKDNDNYKIKLRKENPIRGHRPSVDYLLRSAYEAGIKNSITVIMTGMGNDGSEGLKELSKSGTYAIAEAESTSVIYGMHKAAVETGLVSKIVPLDRISAEIVQVINKI